jgi:hypothetical protein
VEWAHQQGTPADDGGSGISADHLGNIYVTGYTAGDLANLNAGLGDGFVSKYDSSGILQWTSQFGTADAESGRKVAADSLGNVFVAGNRVHHIPALNYYDWDGYVRMFDAAGNQQWTEYFGSSSQSDHLYAMSADGLGNVYVSGHTTGTLGDISAGGYDAFLRKYDSTGTHLWTRQFGNNLGQTSTAVAADGLGAVYIGGGTAGSLGGPSAGGVDAFIAKYNNAGTLQWSQQIGTSAYDDCWGVATDSLGNVYISGATEGNLGGTSSGLRDAYIAKYSASGELLWTQQWGSSSDEGDVHLAIDSLGFVYATGLTWGDLDGTSLGLVDAFVTKLDQDGNLVWSKQFGTEATEAGRDITVASNGWAYVTGETRGGSLGGPNAGGDDSFIVKISEVPEWNTIVLTGLAIVASATQCRRRQLCQ